MADKTINVRVQNKYDTEANWKAKDPVLLKGEQAFTSDGTNANKYKVGNGTAKWSALPYAKADLSKGDVTTALGYTPPTSNTWRGIQNNLTSDSTTDSLSAAQGKVLKGLVDGKAASSHTHDDRYYTESEMNTKLSGKSDTGHKHAISDVTNLQSTLDGKANNHSHPYLPLSGGTMTGGISYKGSQNTYSMIRFIDNPSDAFGNGISIGGGGATIIGGGESCDAVKSAISHGGNEKLILANDNVIDFYTNCDGGIDKATHTTIDATGLYSGTAAKANSVPWSGVTGKPSTFTPSSHTHTTANITDFGTHVYDAAVSRTANTVLAAPNGSNGVASFRKLVATDLPSHTHTKSQITDFPTSLPASDVSAWAKASTKPSYSWGEITGKPTTFTPVSHTHNYAGSSSAGGAANSANKLNNSGQITTVDALNNFNEASIFKYATMAALDGLNGLAKNDGIILSAPWSSANYGHQIFLDDNGYTIAHRYRDNGTWSSWKTLIDSSNIGSQSVSHASTADSATTATQLSSSAGSATQPVYFSGGKPVATTYTLGKSVPSNAVFTDTNTWRGIQNNLTSDSTSDSLSAAQGKILKGLVDGKAASGHSHSSVNDSGNGVATTFAYSKAGMNYGDYSWLAGWNGTELRAVSKSQFATAGHTHNYAGSSSAGGVANSAAKLSTARSIALGGLSSGSANFDGSGNITIDNWGYGTKKYVTTDSMSAPYFRIAYCEDKGSYSDRSMIFVIDSGYSGGGFGIVKVALRNNNISTANQSGCELKWLVRQGFAANQLLIKGNAPAGGAQYADLYFKATGTYQAVSVTVLSMGGRGSKSRCWTFEEGAPRANPDIRTYSYTVEGSDGGTSSYANSAGAVAWTNVSGRPSSLPASDVYSWAKASSKPSYTKSEVGLGNVDNTADSAKSVKYATSAGSANSVAWGNVSGKPSTYYTHPSYTAKASGLYKVTVDSTGHVSAATAVTKADITGLGIPGSDTNTWIAFKGATTSAAGTAGYAPAPAAGAANRYLRSDGTWAVPPDTNTNTWRPLGTSADTACAGNDSRLSNARPASDVYSWAKASSKPSYSWSEIGSKPSTFTPSSHDHSRITLYTGSKARPTNINFSANTNEAGTMFHFVATSSTTTGKPPVDSNVLQMNWDNNGGYDSQFAISTTGADAYFRGQNGGTWTAWHTLLHSDNYTTYTVTKTGSGASGTWGINITGSSASCTGNAATASNASKVNGHTVNSDVPSGAKFTDTNTWRGIQDNLTSTSTSDSLSANQGRILKAAVDGKAAASHTHSYLPLTGGTLTNTLSVSTGANEAQVNVINKAISGRLVASNAGRFGLYDVSYSRWVIMENTTDAANGPGSGLNNVVINSWNGVSFTTNCASQKYSNVTAVGIDCRNGIIKSNKLQLNSTGGPWLVPTYSPSESSIYITTAQSKDTFHPYFTVKSYAGHVATIGGLGNDFGIYSYLSSRKDNGYDGHFGINLYNSQICSDSIYNTTASTGTSNVVITPEHFIKRGSSASKYKLDIRNIDENACYPYKILHINPRQWFDKGDTERYAEYLTDLYTDNVDDNKPYALGDISLTPSYGLVAEDLEEAGLEKFCVYGKENEDGTKEVEGIQYDRLPILFIPILRDLVDCMQKVIPAVKGNITDEKLLAEVNELESRFATFSSDKIVKKTYDVEITSK